MKLSHLLSPWSSTIIPDREIQHLTNDSRQVKPGSLFLAYPGSLSDGREFINQALQSGATTIVYEARNWPAHFPLPPTDKSIALDDLIAKLGLIASRFYGNPSEHLAVTGITGTNGKTTIAYQLAQAHALLGKSAAYIGTLGEGEVSALNSLANTTPDALFLQSLLQRYGQQSIQQVCMEVSSHALCQRRVESIHFQQAIFSNLTHDHLDYHHTMSAYAQAKGLLFKYPSLHAAIINQDDPYAEQMISYVKPSCRLLTYGIKTNADVRVLDKVISLTGIDLIVDSLWGQYPLHINSLGYFNIYNTLAIFTSLMVADYPVQQVIEVIAQLKAAPGRMEVVTQRPYVIVDYAHTPDALENALATLSYLKKKRLLLVFGCGGDRDQSKRAMMGKIASQYADYTIITSDNPRHEDPLKIITDICQGLDDRQAFCQIIDRKQAIAHALSLADEHDMILIAGKGHEFYQQIGSTRYAFSDQDIVRSLSS